MSRPLPSDTLEAAVRAHFGLSQEELARYLGVTRGLVAHLEAGRRLASAAANRRLDYLGHLLPPPTGQGPAAPDFAVAAAPAAPLPPVLPGFGLLPAEPLRQRLRQVAAQAADRRWALHRANKGTKLRQRRQWGLALLQGSPPPGDPAEQAHLARWLAVLAADVAAAAPDPAGAAAQALATVRLVALELEAAALSHLLGES